MIEAYSIEPCRHSLCKGCIDHLVDLMQPCPLCRGEIRTAQKDWTLSNVISEMYRAAAATLLHLPVRARGGDAAVGAMPVAVPTALPRAELRPRVPDSGQRVHTTEAPRARAAAAVTPPSGLLLLPPQEQRDMVRPLMPINRCSDAFLDQLLSNCRTDRDVCYAVFRVWIPDLDLTQILGDSH
uniref:RING-type domain-containing protein n=1 Tax=Bodo saltans TaxID=75058 RepID=B6DT79_BODSA|nr:hypothetical protein [Bodo saltans]